jgi:uncharacterized protein
MSSRNHLKHPLLACALALGGLASVPAHAATDDAGARSVIIARGSGEVRVRPDSIHIDVGTDAQATTLDDAKSRVSTAMEKVLDALHALPLRNLTIETKTIRFTPITSPAKEGRGPAIVGFTASNRVLVTAKSIPEAELASRAGQIVDAALQAGANDVTGLDFFLADPSQAEDEALTLAVQNAASDAKTIAAAVGVTLAGPVWIEEASASHAPRSFSLEAAVVSTPIAVGDITIESEVTVKYAFR